MQAQHPSAKTAFLPLFLLFWLSNWKQIKLSRTNIKLHLHEASNIAPLGFQPKILPKAFPSTLVNSWRLVENYLFSRSNGFKQWNTLRKDNDNSLKNISLFPGTTDCRKPSLCFMDSIYSTSISTRNSKKTMVDLVNLHQTSPKSCWDFNHKSPIFRAKGHSCSRIARPPWYCSPQLRWWWW